MASVGCPQPALLSGSGFAQHATPCATPAPHKFESGTGRWMRLLRRLTPGNIFHTGLARPPATASREVGQAVAVQRSKTQRKASLRQQRRACAPTDLEADEQRAQRRKEHLEFVLTQRQNRLASPFYTPRQ